MCTLCSSVLIESGGRLVVDIKPSINYTRCMLIGYLDIGIHCNVWRETEVYWVIFNSLQRRFKRTSWEGDIPVM